ncbi:MAG: NAD(P)/FAD-dependent oxidoreductase [Puniceicoccales bacterium]|jgi:phytoene dehydrogenase-like protein|nr:NAD(P)/FAD-dependent oxidoreductase [Puniceicoccales bacterium]
MGNMKYDSVIIGAGLSGLASGIRLAQFGKNVLVVEKHNIIGGLNSFYSRFGRKIDVGLHAITNFVKKGIFKSPLSKLLRQLRIPYDLLGLCEQNFSKIILRDKVAKFSNDFLLLESEIARLFPKSIDAFRKLVESIRAFDAYNEDSRQDMSTRTILSSLLQNRELEDMLLLPTLYYGSARENDVTWKQFVILFRSIFLEGFARPFEGIRKILALLVQKFQELGGEKRLRCEVQRIETSNGKVEGVVFSNGEFVKCDSVLSTIGYPETVKLYNREHFKETPKGQLSFCEAIAIFDRQPQDYGWNDTIIFFEKNPQFSYKKSSEEMATSSGVICLPNNFNYDNGQSMKEGFLRVTALANYEKWKNLPATAYQFMKKYCFDSLMEQAVKILGDKYLDFNVWKNNLLDRDFFTPLTIERFTGRVNGAIYGSPEKIYDGVLPIKNLFLCGTDQGFLGIIGSMLSGISIVNRHLLLGK